MRGLENIGSKGHFSAKNGGFWVKTPLGSKREFFSKIRLEHFFRLIKMNLCAKNHQNLMRGSPDMVWRTDGRTHGRTDGRTDAQAWIHRPFGWSRETKKCHLGGQKGPNIRFWLFSYKWAKICRIWPRIGMIQKRAEDFFVSRREDNFGVYILFRP